MTTASEVKQTNTTAINRPSILETTSDQESNLDYSSSFSLSSKSQLQNKDIISTKTGDLILDRSERAESRRQSQLEEGSLQLEGNVLEMDDISIMCEIRTRGGIKRISLPRNLFPSDIHYGMPILFEIKETDGVRRLEVQERPINLERSTEGKAEMDALLKRLGAN